MQPYRSYPTQRSSFSLIEKLILLAAVCLFLGGLIGYIYDRRIPKSEQPAVGGTYSEGVIADSPTKVERILSRITNVGLTYQDTDNSIKPALASSWEVSPDGKTYTFHIHDGYSAEGLLATIQNSKTNWTDIQITAPNSSTLQFILNEPLNSFLPTTSAPLFPYGPYEVIKRDKQEVVLRANNQFVLGEPYLQKIIIKQFQNADDLLSAAKTGEVSGSADLTGDIPKTFKQYTIELPRYYVLFFNMTRPLFKKVEDRQRVVNQADGSPVTYSLLTSQGGASSDLADTLVSELGPKHITITVQKKNSVTLQKEDIPKRDFDLLLYGVDYGVFPDYYPFWHSSQATSPGLNISGVKDKDLDALLESARREQDPVKREALTSQIEAYLKDKALQKIMNQETFDFWVDNSVKGVEYGKIDEGNDRFALIWRWHLKTKFVKSK